MKQLLAGDQAQHGVAQELELFVVPEPLLGFPRGAFELAGLRAMGQSLLEQLRSDTATSESLLELGEIP